MRKELLSLLLEQGTLAEPAVVEHLLAQADPIHELRKIIKGLQESRDFLTMEEVLRIQEAERIARRAAESLLRRETRTPAVRISEEAHQSGERAQDYSSRIEILRDVTGHSESRGKLQDFQLYFQDRFQTLGGILSVRRELQGCVGIEQAKKYSREVRFLGMVRSVRAFGEAQLLEVEDASGTATVLYKRPPAQDPIVEDEVIGVVGISKENGKILSSQVFHPDIPETHRFTPSADPVWAAFISDVHVGAKSFLGKSWDKFSSWLNEPEGLAREVKYLVVSGDLVDGVGIYPDQEEELATKDIYAQYEQFAKSLEALPDHLQVVLLPGNHDAVRLAEPQPALPREIQKMFSSNATFLGNPSSFALSGVKILAYHGRSFDSWVGRVPGLTYGTPLLGMRQMLRKRHLSPIYGSKTPIAPEHTDYLAIDREPDIFVTGHVHGVGSEEYRGVRMVNSSTWQAQTPFQLMHNIVPKTGFVPLVHLSSGETITKHF